MRQHLFIYCSLEMTEFRQKLVRQPELHQPPWSLLLVPRMTPQANGEERHDLEPTAPRGGISASALGRWCLLSENAFDGSAGPASHGGGMQEKQSQEQGSKSTAPLLLPGSGTLTWAYLQGAFLHEKRRCPRRNGRQAVLAWYTLMPSCHVIAEGFQQYFFFT